MLNNEQDCTTEPRCPCVIPANHITVTLSIETYSPLTLDGLYFHSTFAHHNPQLTSVLDDPTFDYDAGSGIFKFQKSVVVNVADIGPQRFFYYTLKLVDSDGVLYDVETNPSQLVISPPEGSGEGYVSRYRSYTCTLESVQNLYRQDSDKGGLTTTKGMNETRAEFIADETRSRSGQADLQTNHFSVSPNPFSDRLFVSHYAARSEDVSFELFDATGKKVLSRMLNSGGELYREPIDTNGLPPGIYICVAIAGEDRQVLKLVK